MQAHTYRIVDIIQSLKDRDGLLQVGLAEGERSMRIWKTVLPKLRSLACPQLPLREMQTAPRIPTRRPMPSKFSGKYTQANHGRASVTICLRKPHEPLPKLWLTSDFIDRVSLRQTKAFGAKALGERVLHWIAHAFLDMLRLWLSRVAVTARTLNFFQPPCHNRLSGE
jgi:hypothetical protein